MNHIDRDKPKQTEAERLQMLVDIAKEGQEVAKIMKDYADKNPMSWVLRPTQPEPVEPVEPEPVEPSEIIEALCARIKAADDAAADRDYMLDSDDCIAVIRGTWKAPMMNDKPDKSLAAAKGGAV